MSVFHYFERKITNPTETLKVAKMPQTNALQQQFNSYVNVLTRIYKCCI